jgi:hypothetical protein
LPTAVQSPSTLTSFSSHIRNNNVQQPTVSTTIDHTKRLQSPHLPSSSTSSVNYATNMSTTYLNVLTPIFSHLANKYRLNQSPNASASNSSNIEQSIDELKSAFFHLEQQNPGACDLFIKYLFQYLKPSPLSPNHM